MNKNRPLSPHLQVYNLPLTGLISITHRITGIMLSVGLIFFVYIIFNIASGEQAYQNMQSITDMLIVRLLYWGFIYALFFHLCHGVRHLIWDSGVSYQHDSMNRNACIELAASIILTLVTFLIF